MIINNIHNHHHYHQQLTQARKKHVYPQELVDLLMQKLKACLHYIPPAQLNRSLRTFLLLNLVEMTNTGFKDYLFDMMEIFEALDRQEDNQQQ